MKNLAVVSQKQEQKFIFLPQMRQAIHILQLPILELKMYIEEEIARNPLLEESDVSKVEAEDAKDAEFAKEIKGIVDFNLDLERGGLGNYGNTEEEPALQDEAEKKRQFKESLVVSRLSLWDELLRQLRITGLCEEDTVIGEKIISNINPDGYLNVNLQEIADGLANGNIKKVEEVLSIIQTFEPQGVASRSIQECLLIQLRLGGKDNSLAAEVIKNHWEVFVKRRYAQLSRALKCSLQHIEEASQEISKLTPRPASAYGPLEAVKTTPDAILTLAKGEYKVLLEEGQLPVVRINSKYYRMLKDKNTSEGDKKFIRDKLNSAMWLIEAIKQRKGTLQKVVQCIVDIQKEFLEKGEGRLKPLTIKDVAEKTQLHPSTVSRITSRKYLQTPMGMYKLKDFFSTAIGSDSEYTKERSTWSAEAVKLEIKGLVAAENRTSPLGDEEIVSRLSQKGIKIARRTVAKYRQGLGILSSHIRR